MKITNIKYNEDGQVRLSGHVDYYGFHCDGQLVMCTPEERDKYINTFVGQMEYKFVGRIEGYGTLTIYIAIKMTTKDDFMERLKSGFNSAYKHYKEKKYKKKTNSKKKSSSKKKSRKK